VTLEAFRGVHRGRGGVGGSVAEGFTCEVDEEYRSACKELPKYPGTRYCVLHDPDAEKNKEDFLKVRKSKLDRKDYDFGGTVFLDGTSNFEGTKFDANTHFAEAKFIGEANFSRAQFSSSEKTYFTEAQFSSEKDVLRRSPVR
jgi:hypothetical protein